MTTTLKATFESFCPACRASVIPGEEIVSGWASIGNVWVHAKCSSIFPGSSFVPRLNEVRTMSHKQAREVAMALHSVVTRNKKYMGHSEVCYRAATATADDARWQSAVSLATGKKVPGTSTPPPPSGSTLTEERIREIAAEVAEEYITVGANATGAKMLDEILGRAETAANIVAREVAQKLIAEKLPPREIVIKLGSVINVIAGRVHKQFDKLLKMLSARCHVWLAGPAGSGKTTAARQVAEALGLTFRFNGAIDTEYKLSGFVDAQGKVVMTPFREAYTQGGLYLFDEVDASLPSAVLAFNAALANGATDFPGEPEPVRAHPDFRCIAAGNTWGMGATTEYVGRSKMDAAFLDRFVQLSWEYDEKLERDLATNTKWCDRVQALRKRAAERGLKVVISPRATIFGCQLFEAGMTWDEVEMATMRAKISKADWTNLTN